MSSVVFLSGKVTSWVKGRGGRLTHSLIAGALEQVRAADVDQWCRSHLGLTLQSQRRLALGATKMG